jgi:hypothetical protein
MGDRRKCQTYAASPAEPGGLPVMLERFQAKWKPVRVKKTRQIKNLEPRFDSIETEKALGSLGCRWNSGKSRTIEADLNKPWRHPSRYIRGNADNASEK